MKDADIEVLKEKAKQVSMNAYAPYSKFPVGAALMSKEGNVYMACNVENGTYGLTVCAERNVVGAMVANGEKEIRAIVIYTPTEKPAESCGACRQVINEFGDDVKIISFCDGEGLIETTIGELLPHAFSGKKSLLDRK